MQYYHIFFNSQCLLHKKRAFLCSTKYLLHKNGECLRQEATKMRHFHLFVAWAEKQVEVYVFMFRK